MAEKLINSRIVLKHDSLENWNASSLVLKEGELAIATVGTATAGQFDGSKTPVIGIKVGDGTHTFSQLQWIQSIAGDVYAWAKAATKPTYNANEIVDLEDYIKDIGGDQYQVVQDQTDGHIFKLQSKSQATGSTWVDVSTITIPDNDTTYTFAEGSVDGEFSVTPSNGGVAGTAVQVKVHGLGSAAFEDVDAFDAAGDAAAVLGTSSDGVDAATVYGARAKAAAVDLKVGSIPAGATATTVVGYVDEKAAAAVSGLDVNDAAVAGKYVSAVGVDANGQLDITRADLPDYSNTYAGKAYESKVDTLIGSDTGKSARTIANEELAAQLIPASAKESLDTLQEIAAWIQSHPDDASKMNAQIGALKDALSSFVTVDSTTGAYTVTADSVKDYIDGEIADLDSSVAATAAAGNKYSVLTGVTQADGVLSAKTEVKLEAIAKTGNINDLIQTSGDVLVLDCGTSA